MALSMTIAGLLCMTFLTGLMAVIATKMSSQRVLVAASMTLAALAIGVIAATGPY